MLNRFFRKIKWLLRDKKRYQMFKRALAKDSLNAELHFSFALACLSMGNPGLALAEFKTAKVLGMVTNRIETHIKQAKSLCPPMIDMDHNTYYRFESLRQSIASLADEASLSVLDIGGGEGGLAQFLHTDNYCLVEPNVNGISGIDLPFENQSFDVVVACHVFEHIPVAQREVFLNQLCTKAKKAVVLLNPFYLEAQDEKKRLEFHVELTGAWWAKEHLAFTLPTLEMVEAFAEQKSWSCDIQPNGSLTLAFANVYVDFFAKKGGQEHDLKKVNRFMNQNFTSIAIVDKYPNAYLVCLQPRSKDVL